LPISTEKWFDGVRFEVGFWQAYLNAKDGPWPEDLRIRLDQNRAFDSLVEAAIPDMGSRQIELLDVGAGPITSLGYISKKFDINITAIDPLADAYSVLLKEAGVTPPIATQKCFGENLLQHFGNRRFHVCHSCNALDHCIDPRAIMRAMAQLLHPNGLMYVRVYKNEGEGAGYAGLHNWNFDKDKNNNFILWRGAEKYKVNEDLSDLVEGRLTEVETGERPSLAFVGYRKAN
jgi:SAM-dependent methyltransferase